MRTRKRVRGSRKLQLEPLENRRLLMGDGCATLPDDSSGEVAVASANAASLVTASDAGGTFATAANLGVVSGTVQRNGTLSYFDRVDTIRFEVTGNSDVTIRLDQMTRDADLFVLDADGNQIGASERSGRSNETLSGQLPAGEYYIAIIAESFWSNRYRITVQVELLEEETETSPTSPNEVPGGTNTPEGESPVPENTPAATPPTSVNPLSDVAYYGGSRDWNINAVEAPEAWAAGYTGEGVTVAVIDTGVDLDHPDLVNNLYVNPGEIPGNGIDDDGNGYVDDVSGYDFVSRDARPDDGNGHGTHVAGTIAAARNGTGATGVAPDAKILPVRVLGNSGSGSDFNVAAGIRYAADIGAQIINLSLGGSYSSRILSAIEYATAAGSLVVAAAGNESAGLPSYPARHSANSTSVLSVGAHDSSGRIAGFSNDVGGSGSVQVDAPGVGVYSTYPGGRYASLSGTSMASPHVAGVAALTLSANPNLTSSELRELLATGTVGQAAGSDGIGTVSASYSVAYAAAGLTTVGGTQTSSASAAARAGTTRVRASLGTADGSAILPAASTRLVVSASTQLPQIPESFSDGQLLFSAAEVPAPTPSDIDHLFASADAESVADEAVELQTLADSISLS